MNSNNFKMYLLNSLYIFILEIRLIQIPNQHHADYHHSLPIVNLSKLNENDCLHNQWLFIQ